MKGILKSHTKVISRNENLQGTFCKVLKHKTLSKIQLKCNLKKVAQQNVSAKDNLKCKLNQILFKGTFLKVIIKKVT